MSHSKSRLSMPGRVGLIGFGAFGRLVAAHLGAHFPIVAVDPCVKALDDIYDGRVSLGTLADMADCDIIILAVPVSELACAIQRLRPHLRPGTTIVDVGSVKVAPARIMAEGLPAFVDIVGTHPLFGPQSARDGIRGHRIAVCPVRGNAAPRIAAFLRRVLGLKVFITSPEEHDREAAIVQGVTHLIAKVLVRMGPLPDRLTTASFDCLMAATEMVRYDSPGVFLAIERDNPYAAAVRERFFALAVETKLELEREA